VARVLAAGIRHRNRGCPGHCRVAGVAGVAVGGKNHLIPWFGGINVGLPSTIFSIPIGGFVLGISILAPWVAQKELAEGSLKTLQLGRAKLRRRWGILSRKGARLNLQQATFIGLCRAVADNLSHAQAG
jgi:hypothetical protein